MSTGKWVQGWGWAHVLTSRPAPRRGYKFLSIGSVHAISFSALGADEVLFFFTSWKRPLTTMPSAAFVRFWRTDITRDCFLSYAAKEDCQALRLVCHSFSTTVAPHIFSHMSTADRIWLAHLECSRRHHGILYHSRLYQRLRHR